MKKKLINNLTAKLKIFHIKENNQNFLIKQLKTLKKNK